MNDRDMSGSISVELSKWTRREFRERMAGGSVQAALLPVAAIEQHLEHLAMEHDWRSTHWVACRVAERLAPRVVVAPACMVGVSEHHMKHPGTLTLQPGTFLNVLADLIDSLVRAGFDHVLVLNGHGGNIAPVEGTWEQFLRMFPVNLHFLSYWDVLTKEDAQEVLEGGSDALPGHAQEFETSLALAHFPENVRKAALADQLDTSPSLASEEKGRVLGERIVTRVAEYVRDMIEGRRTVETPPFFP